MIRKKELFERINSLEDEIKQQNEVLKFLTNHDKNDLLFELGDLYFTTECYIKYIYNGELCKVRFGYYKPEDCKVIENNEEYSIILCENGVICTRTSYYKLDKRTGVLMEITDLQNKINKVKDCENLKHTVEALGDALSSIFSAPKQKTQKKAKPSEKTKAKCECEKKNCKKGGNQK